MDQLHHRPCDSRHALLDRHSHTHLQVRWRHQRHLARLLKQFAHTVNFDEGANRL